MFLNLNLNYNWQHCDHYSSLKPWSQIDTQISSPHGGVWLAHHVSFFTKPLRCVFCSINWAAEINPWTETHLNWHVEKVWVLFQWKKRICISSVLWSTHTFLSSSSLNCRTIKYRVIKGESEMRGIRDTELAQLHTTGCVLLMNVLGHAHYNMLL